ncbi:Zinc finger BED domain-containing protein 5 [Eumeta japonica]|uniref:Zinc finger BED domain-containing protein 5 n=1 Tax=Eumeta variegata TaxID=151549 RepID=A0A4C1TID9_EUMVA|nr:Zinc finger BED domain-containing protein 5 [Eumeta japonica]
MTHVTQIINEKATEASYLVSYPIAQASEAHTIADNLIKPCVLDITKCMLDEKSEKHRSTVPLSKDTVSRRIHDLASYVKQELVTRLQKIRFALQMDELTNVAGLVILPVIIFFIVYSRGKRACEPSKSRWSPPPMDTRNPREVTGVLLGFLEVNKVSNREKIGMTERDKGSGPPELSLTD